jgi:hypothetical protein
LTHWVKPIIPELTRQVNRENKIFAPVIQLGTQPQQKTRFVKVVFQGSLFLKTVVIFVKTIYNDTVGILRNGRGAAMDLMTAKEAAELWGITTRQVQLLCVKGQIAGAERLGKIRVIPKGTTKPVDGRTKAAKPHSLCRSGKHGHDRAFLECRQRDSAPPAE